MSRKLTPEEKEAARIKRTAYNREYRKKTMLKYKKEQAEFNRKNKPKVIPPIDINIVYGDEIYC